MSIFSLLRAGSIALLIGISANSQAAISPYLPVNMSPEIERQIERLMQLADVPVYRKPIPASQVQRAIDNGCDKAPDLCWQVKRYLERYKTQFGLTHLSAEVSYSDQSKQVLPNSRGISTDSSFNVSAQGFWQPVSWGLVNVGGIAWEQDNSLEGTYLSLGFDSFRIDAGLKPHWFGPLSDSAMTHSTQAKTYKSVSISSERPLTFLGINYEFFGGELSHSDRIRWEDGYTSGTPGIVGMQIALEPVPGFALGVNRVMQFGGGARGGNSLKDFLKAFFDPVGADNRQSVSQEEEFGNQVAGLFSTMSFDTQVPFTVKLEYAGEDTSRNAGWRLGNAALLTAIDFPLLWEQFDLTLERGEWQNAWYTHSIYEDGLTNDGQVIGHWGGDARRFGDSAGATSYMARLGWNMSPYQRIDLRYSTLKHEAYAQGYTRMHDLSLRYSHGLERMLVGSELYLGRDVFDSQFAKIALFARW